MSLAQTVLALLVPLSWGLQYVVIKVGLTAFPPLFFVALRFAAVAAILLPFVGMLEEFAVDVSGGSIAGCAHWLPEARPVETADAVLKVLAGHGSSSSSNKGPV